MRRLCVYCGSSPGRRPLFLAAAREMGRELAGQGIGLVYGGGSVGLMGELADTVLAAGGEVVGVIPQFLVDAEVAHTGLTELVVVESMHARKAKMASLADGFAALPGGLGTVEELVEMLTWSQLGLHGKPCGLLAVDGYFDGLLAFLDRAVEEGFVKPVHRGLLLTADAPRELLRRMAAFRHRPAGKWSGRATASRG